MALPPVCLAVWYGPPAASALFAAASAISAFEYYRIVLGRLPREAWAGLVAAAALPLLPAAIPRFAAAAAFGVVSAGAVAVWLLRLTRSAPTGATGVAGHVLAGLLFCGPGMFALASIRSGADGQGWTFALLLVTWSNDTCAYAVGRMFGRRPLAPAISPGKTWEGLFGGAAGSLLATALARATLIPAASPLELALLAFGTSVIGPLGDLAKSTVKRAHGVKDSGRLLPGHGGLLDRIDALLWNSLAVAALRAS